MTEQRTPHVTLIIAAYNRGAAFRPTLESVLAQSCKPHEILVVDDGSTDGTAQWVAEHFPTVQVLTKTNGGTSSARNFGAEAAKGDILIFLDHDDVLLPDAVEKLVELLARFPEAQSAHCDHEYHNRSTGVVHANHHATLPSFQRLKQIAPLRSEGNARLFGRGLYAGLLQGNILQQPWAVRRSAFKDVGGYAEDIRYCEDWDIYLRLAERFPIAVSDDVISLHIVEGENLHLTASEKQEAMYTVVLQRRFMSPLRKDWHEGIIIRRKLAWQEKERGDRAMKEGNRRSAWNCYWQSAKWWPNDFVVLVRLLIWSPLVYPFVKNLRRNPTIR